MKEKIIDLVINNVVIAKLNLKSIEEKKIVIVIIGSCPFCNKKVKGSTHSQVEWNLALHIKQKHKDNPEAKVLLEQLEEQNKTK
jgi:hypothetical protein